MDLKCYMIIKGGRDITSEVVRCDYKRDAGKYDVAYQSGFAALHNLSTILKISDPVVLKLTDVLISCNDKVYFDLVDVRVFTQKDNAGNSYYRFWSKDGKIWSKHAQELKVIGSCMQNPSVMNRFEYLKQLALLNELKAEDGTLLLQKQYEKLDFIGEDTALSVYLRPETEKPKQYPPGQCIFPFGCNSSQHKAVLTALTNQISVIQGPPGTGKTQTILNIIANLLTKNCSVLVVSNNNSATENVLEKLSSKQYEMGFLVAPLGSGANKESFLQGQSGIYPDLSGWKLERQTELSLPSKITALSTKLSALYEQKERMACAQQELSALETEMKYFEVYCKETVLETNRVRMRRALNSNRIMQLWLECFDFSDRELPISFWYRVKSVLYYGISDWDFFKSDIAKVFTLLISLYYQTKRAELKNEIAGLKKSLEQENIAELQKELTQRSMECLRGSLFRFYGTRTGRIRFKEDLLIKVKA